MEKLYKKNELTFALVWIAIYVVAISVADSISKDMGVARCITLPVCIALSAAIWFVMKKLDILEKNGIRKWRGSAKQYAYFAPLVVMIVTQFGAGAQMNMSAVETALYIGSMLCVGFLEEVIFRGFLFNALLKDNKLVKAILIAGITFGFGHIVNLLNGREVVSTLRQLVYASAIGVTLTVLLYVSKSLWPCIVFHSVFNSLSVFAGSGSTTYEWIWTAVIVAICLVYAGWLWKKNMPEQKQAA